MISTQILFTENSRWNVAGYLMMLIASSCVPAAYP
jgi:hypothetical protein